MNLTYAFKKCPGSLHFTLLLQLGEKRPYSEVFLSVFSRIRTEQGEVIRISTYSVRMQENVDQNNSKYGQFLRSM